MTRHDADEVIGRITNSGQWDRRYRIRYAPPEPIEPEGWRMFFEVIAGVLVFGGLLGGLWMWAAIAAAAAA